MSTNEQSSRMVLEAVSDITKRLHDKTFLLAWVEPKSNQSEKQLPKVIDLLASLFGFSKKGRGEEPSEEYVYVHPFNGEELTGRARVLNLEKWCP